MVHWGTHADVVHCDNVTDVDVHCYTVTDVDDLLGTPTEVDVAMEQ